MSIIQAPKAVVMVRPWKFHSNPETAADNAFQTVDNETSNETVADNAKAEFNNVVDTLTKNGVKVHAFDDLGEKETPDSVFPNNWFSTHVGGQVAVYPMYSRNRRRERRSDIIEMLKAEYVVKEVVDYSSQEMDNCFLEGTGAMVLDHINRVSYTAISNRASEVLLERFCTQFSYEPMAFETADDNGIPTYHTNVMMCLATDYVVICLDMISDEAKRAYVKQRLVDSGRDIIDISIAQMNGFAGNALELTGTEGSLLAMSECAYNAFTEEQIQMIEKHSTILAMPIPTIELAGGSIRCMLAGIHLTAR